MAKMIFVNLAVDDLARATTFYEAVGCTRDPVFSNDAAAMLVWSDAISFMLLTKPFYATFTSKPIADPRESSEVLICLSRDSREDVDGFIASAVAGGGHVVRPVQDQGFMYGGTVEDPDGHTLEIMWMDVDAAKTAMAGRPDDTAEIAA